MAEVSGTWRSACRRSSAGPGSAETPCPAPPPSARRRHGARTAGAADRAFPVDLRPAAPGAARATVATSAAPPVGTWWARRRTDIAWLAAILADQGDQVAGSRNLDQHRTLGQSRPHHVEHLVRQPGGPCRGSRCSASRCPRSPLPVGPHAVPPRRSSASSRSQPRSSQRLQLGGPGIARKQRAGAGSRRRAAPARPARGDRERAARPADRRRRPRARPGPNHGPARTRPRGCRSPPAPGRAAPQERPVAAAGPLRPPGRRSLPHRARCAGFGEPIKVAWSGTIITAPRSLSAQARQPRPARGPSPRSDVALGSPATGPAGGPPSCSAAESPRPVG